MTSHASQIVFKPIQRIDPTQSKAAQIARRGPGLTVKFPPIDLDNLPSWPPLSDEEVEDDEDGDMDEENDQGEDDVEHFCTSAMIHLPPNASQPWAPTRRPSYPRETPSRAPEVQFDSFIPAGRRCPPPASRGSRNYFASNPLRNCLSRNESVACPVPSTLSPPSSPNRHRRSGVGDTSPRNYSPFPIAGTHASRLVSQMAAPSVSFATRSQSRPVHGNSHTSLVGNGAVGNNAMPSRAVTAVRHAGNQPSPSHIPINAPIPAQDRTAVVPETLQGEESRPNKAIQTTFRMAMELSKPYQPGLRASNHHFAMVSGDSIHLIPCAHIGFPSAEPDYGQAHVAGDRNHPTGRNSNRELSNLINVAVDRQVSPDNGFPSPSAADASSVDDDVPLGLDPRDEEQTDLDDSELADSPSRLPALLEGAMNDEEENDDENRTVSMSPAIGQRKQEQQTQTNFQANPPGRAAAPTIVGQQPVVQNHRAEIHGDAMSTPHDSLTSENMARLDQQNTMWWKIPERETSAAANSSRRSSACSGLPTDRDFPCSSRPPTRCPTVNRPFVRNFVNHDENRQSLEHHVPAAPFRPRDSVRKVPKKRRRIVVKQEEDEESMPTRKR